MINGYDFDKTIYDGDSTLDFYLYCLKHQFSLIRFLPIQFYGFLVYKLKIKRKEYFKEKFYTFLKGIKHIDVVVNNFWDENESKIKNWYLDQKKESDVIISASPEFLLSEICKRLKIESLLASKVDKNTGKLLSNNCYGNEKVKRFKEAYPKAKLHSFYSDSYSDMPIINLAKKGYIVKKNDIKEI